METVLLILGLVLLTAFIFVVWVCVRVVGLIVRGIVGLARPTPAPPAPPHVQGLAICAAPNCRATNPSHARFCRRCGGAFAAGANRMRYVA